MTAGTLVIRNVEVEGRRRDVTIKDRTIVTITPPSSPANPSADAHEIDGTGGSLIPGLHDHHVHLMALAAARESLKVDANFRATLSAAVGNAPAGTWLRAVGLHESILGEIDRSWLDAIAPHHPVRVQHRSGAMWVLNTAALRATGLESESGRLLRVDDVLRERVPGVVPDVAAVGRELATYGATGVSDLTPLVTSADMTTLAEVVTAPDFPLDVMVTGAPTLPPDARLGVVFGPAKVVIGDHDLPSIDEIVRWFREARRHGRAVAVHCVTRVGLILALAAWAEVGSVPGDRIEHAAVVPAELIDAIRQLDLAVVTQPSFTCERGDTYLAEVDDEDLDGLWRCGSLLDAGISVAGSTDAPYGSADPWRAIAAASERLTATGKPIGLGERIDARRGLDLFLGSALDPGGRVRRIGVGEPGDVCLLDAPCNDVLASPSSAHVVATIGRSGITWS